jgi:hypothetical protein
MSEALSPAIMLRERGARAFLKKAYPVDMEKIDTDYHAFQEAFPSMVAQPSEQVRYLTGRAWGLSVNHGMAAPQGNEKPEFFYDTRRVISLAMQLSKDLPKNEQLTLIDELAILEAAEICEAKILLRTSNSAIPTDLSFFPKGEQVLEAQLRLKRARQIGEYKAKIIKEYKTLGVEYHSLLQTF